MLFDKLKLQVKDHTLIIVNDTLSSFPTIKISASNKIIMAVAHVLSYDQVNNRGIFFETVMAAGEDDFELGHHKIMFAVLN